MVGKGFDTELKQLNELNGPLQRSTIARGLGNILTSIKEIDVAAGNLRSTRLNDLPEFFSQNDPTAKLQQTQAAWNRLMVAVGDAGSDRMIQVLDATTSGLNRLSGLARENPRMSEAFTGAALGLGAVATGMGALSAAAFVLTPALGLLRGAMGAAAGAGALGMGAGAAATGARGTGLAGLLAANPASAVAAATVGVLAVGSAAETPENRASRESLARTRRFDPMAAPSDGFGADGRPGGPSVAARPPSATPARVNLNVDLVADGQRLARVVSRNMATEASGPSRGTTGPDMRVNLGGR